jgi:hypothetical protein
MIDKLKQEGKVDIFNFVLQMRRERNLMVQTVVCLFNLNKKKDLFLSDRNNMYLFIDLYLNIIFMVIRKLR